MFFRSILWISHVSLNYLQKCESLRVQESTKTSEACKQRHQYITHCFCIRAFQVTEFFDSQMFQGRPNGRLQGTLVLPVLFSVSAERLLEVIYFQSSSASYYYFSPEELFYYLFLWNRTYVRCGSLMDCPDRS